MSKSLIPVATVSTRSKKKISSTASEGMFRPKLLEPPKIGNTVLDYNVYVQNYRFYLAALGSFKEDFWSTRGKKVSHELVASTATFVAKKTGGLVGPISGQLPVATEGTVTSPFLKAVTTVSTVVPVPSTTSPGVEKKSDAAKAASKLARRRRYRANKRQRDVKSAVTFSSNLVQLAANNKALSKSKFTFGTIGVSPHCVVLPGRKKQKGKGKKALPKGKEEVASGSSTPRGPPGPPGPEAPRKDTQSPTDDSTKGQEAPAKESGLPPSLPKGKGPEGETSQTGATLVQRLPLDLGMRRQAGTVPTSANAIHLARFLEKERPPSEPGVPNLRPAASPIKVEPTTPSGGFSFEYTPSRDPEAPGLSDVSKKSLGKGRLAQFPY